MTDHSPRTRSSVRLVDCTLMLKRVQLSVNELPILQHSTAAKIVAYFRTEGIKALALLGMHVVCRSTPCTFVQRAGSPRCFDRHLHLSSTNYLR
jgi:hypothetical protein